MDDINIKFYQELYSLTDQTTPMMFDCGLLCSSACCRGSEGMLLFPGEDEYLDFIGHDFNISDTNINTASGTIRLLACDGVCPREKRPLACRMFPLFPFLRKDRIIVDFDPRAKGTCPLLLEDMEGIYISGLFRLRVLEAGYLMSKEKGISDFLRMMTLELDEIAKFKL